jgi:uncharacterized protein
MDPVFHFELPAKDMGRAKTFYERVFGWEIAPLYDSYYLAKTTSTDDKNISQTSGEINGAIQKKDDSIGSLRIVIKVPDLDEALRKVLGEGGKIFIPKKKLPSMFYSVIFDSEGNEINLVEEIF